MTEEIAATPGWVERRLDEVFAALPEGPAIARARRDYAHCLARRKAPATPSDLLGTEFDGCRPALRRALAAEGIEGLAPLDQALEALEAEIAAST